MSDKEKHMPTYSSSDIEKYLSGELSASDMHALERAALDDPFLADALEGMAAHRQLPGQPSFTDDMTDLQQRLQDRVAVKKKSAVLLLFMRYAAVLILLAGIGVTVFYMRRDKSSPVASQDHVPVAPAETEPDALSTLKDSIAAVQTATASQSAKARTADTVRTKLSAGDYAYHITGKKKRALAPGGPAKKETEDEVAKPSDGEAAKADDKRMAFKDANMAKKYSVDTLYFDTSALRGATANYTTNAAAPLVFTGKVTDFNNHPLRGAYLALKNNQYINTRTDKYGNFNLRLPNNQDTAAVVVNYAGYTEGSMTLSNENRVGNVIQLRPQSASLNEVVVSGYGAKRKEYLRKNIDAPQKALSQVALPANGWPAYNEYLEANKRSVSLDSTLRGNESISFVVDKSGELSAFKVEQSISPAHDAHLTRLIKQGPAWRLLTGKKTRARVILTY